jgi:hypothetical protein
VRHEEKKRLPHLAPALCCGLFGMTKEPSMSHRAHQSILAAGALASAAFTATADVIPLSRFSEFRVTPPGGPPTVASTTAFGLWEYGFGFNFQTSNTLLNGATLSTLINNGSGKPIGYLRRSTFQYVFVVSEPHAYSFSGSLFCGGGASAVTAEARLQGPGVNHVFAAQGMGGIPVNVPFNVTGILTPGTYTVSGSCNLSNFGQASENFVLTLQVPGPASALLAPFLVLSPRRRRPG